MTEIKLYPPPQSSNQNQNQQNQQDQQQQQQHDQEDAEAAFVASQFSNRPQYPSRVVVKESTFLGSIYRLLGFNSKNVNDDYECTTREIGTLIMLGILLLAFLISTTGFFIMWFTDVYNNQFTSKLVLANNSIASEWWIHPPLSTHLKVHIFNYTNIEDYIKGKAKKIVVEDLGPYTYAENATKVGVQFNPNSTVTYQVHRAYKFLPEYSTGRQFDQVIVPNIPLISAFAFIKDESYLFRAATAMGIESTNPKLFTKVAADSLLWGYTDGLVNVIQTFKTLPSGKFGLLVNRNGTNPDVFQIHTGEDDIRKLGIISQFNGREGLNFWSTEACNRVDGTDGSQFPPYLMDKKHKLEVFIQAMCRKLPLYFDSEVNLFEGVPAWRYKTPTNVFSHPDINPDNQCYCHIDSGVCAPSGVFNGSLCYDAPIFVSFPHFFSGDPILYKDIEGINPEASKHQTFADIHPRLAFPIGGASRVQINIQVNDFSFSNVQRGKLKQGIILPVMWLEVTSGELTDDLRALIYHSSFSANAIQLALKYGTLLICVTTLALLVAACYYRGKSKELYEREKELESLSKSQLKINEEQMTTH